MNYITRILTALLLVLFISNRAEAQVTATFYPTKDTYLSRNFSNTNYGSSTLMYVQRLTNYPTRALLYFDISSIPPGATILSAQLRLVKYFGNHEDYIDAHPLTQEWTETGATWNSSGITGWTGGAYNTSASYSTQTMVGANTNTAYSWNVLNMVNAWHSGTITNYGVLLKANNETGSSARSHGFYTKEYTTYTSYRPILVVTYCPIAFDMGGSSARCQGKDTITYTAHDGTNEIYYGIDLNSAWAGNAINTSTGEVYWASNWIGESTITATSINCTSTHTVTTRGKLGKPAFILGDTSYRCAGAGTQTYEALANYRDSTIYSLDAASLAAGNTINRYTGTVTYVAGYAGTSTITATSYGCTVGGTKTSTHKAITNNALTAVNDYVSVEQNEPTYIDVLANDICTYDASTLTIITQPSNGSADIVNGKIFYTPLSHFYGNDVLTYRICQTGNVNCSEATVYINVEQNIFDACVSATRSKIFYVPYPENSTQLRKSLLSAASTNSLTSNVRSLLTIKATYPNTVIIYDHWEDGYEADITNPTQRSTLIWGDGNPANGVAPGHPNDIIPPGGCVIIDNEFKYNERDVSKLVFDGKDKFYSTNDILVSKIVGDAGLAGSQPIFPSQNVKTTVYDVDYFGKHFILPLGENITNDLNTNAFRYTGIFVRAMKDGTLVRLDYDGDGSVDVSKVLNEGEVWFYDGTASVPGSVANDVNKSNDIKAGADLTATEPVGVDMVFGGIDYYGTRNISVLPDRFNGPIYYCPVYETNPAAPVYAFFTNILPTPITINWTCGNGDVGSVVVQGQNYNYLRLNKPGGYKFESAGGESYAAIVVVDAGTNGSAYDWAFKLISAEQLTPHVGVAWAPGSYNLTGNYNPIWITSPDANTLYIKYDGDLSGATGDMSYCHLPYDSIISVAPLEVLRLYNPSGENRQGGTVIYSCEKKPFSAVWGQDAAVAPTSDPGLDVGYSLLPRCLDELIIANDDRENTEPNTPIEIDVLSNDASFICAINKASLSTTGLLQPQNGTIVINPDFTITYTPNTDFIGTDRFEYRICSQEYSGVCGVAEVTINVVPCQASDNQNIVKGRVYVDRQPRNQMYDDGEKGARGVKVNLYNDTNCNGTIDPEDVIEQTTLTDVHGNFSFITYNGHNVKDTFDPIAGFGGNSGSYNWYNNWSEQGENDGHAAGSVRVATDINSGNNAIRLSGSNRGISRSVTFNDATSAILKFRFRRQGVTVTSALQIKNVEVKLNGYTVYQITTSASKTDQHYTPVFIPLDIFQINPNSENTLQFSTGSNMSTSDYHWIDDVEIIYFNNKSCYITKADPTNTNGTYLTDNTHTNTAAAEFDYIGECSVRGYLSVLANLVAKKDSIVAMTNYPVILNVLSNDTIGRPDPSTVTMVTPPKHGTTTVNPDGTITYTANEGYVGIDSLEYRVCSLDDPEVCSTAFAVIYPYPREPIVTNNSPICHSTQAIFTISGNEGDIITYNINGGAPQQVVIPVAGTVDVTVNSATTDQTINLTNIENKYGIEMPLSISSTIQVYASSVAGTASHDQTICSGSSPATLTLTGNTGLIQWQSSTDNVTYTDIVGATSASYLPEPLTQKTYYRAEVTVSGCTSATSNTVAITVNPLPTFSYTKSDSKCFGDNNGEITVTANGGSGLYIYYLEVENTAGSGTYTPLQNSGAAKSTSHTFMNLEPKNYRVRVVDTNGCEQINCN